MTSGAGVELVLVVEELAEERMIASAVEAAFSVTPLPSVTLYGGPNGAAVVFFEFQGAVPLPVRDRLHQAAHRLEGRLKEGRSLSAADRARFLGFPESVTVAPPGAPAVAAFFAALSKGAAPAGKNEPPALRVPLESEDDAWATYVRHMAEGQAFLPADPSFRASRGDTFAVRFLAPNLIPLEARAEVVEVQEDGLVCRLSFGDSFRAFIVRRGHARREGRPLPRPPEAESRRQHARFAARLEVRFKSAKGLEGAWTTNLSQGGVFVETDSPPPLGATVRLSLHLPDAQSLELEGKVVHVVSAAEAKASGKRTGVGVSFEGQKENVQAAIEPLLQRFRSRKPKILVVDDSEFFRKVLAAELTSQGLDVEMAKDGEDALEKLSRLLFALDLMVLDLKMPGIDGKTLLSRIKGDRKEADLKVVVLSGSSDADLQAVRDPSLTDAVVQKGTAMGEVVALVKRLVAR